MSRRHPFGELASGGDVNRLADAVERDPVPRRQRLHAGDARDDVKIECNGLHRRDLIDDPQRAVVERGIAPDQKSAVLAVG